MRVLRIIPVLFICLFLTGGHYGVLQCVAWAGMLWSYSEQDGLMQAAQDTFSGEKPCCLCEAIAESKQGDPESPEPLQKTEVSKLKELQCPRQLLLRAPAGLDLAFVAHADPANLSGQGRERPVSPPPKWIA